MNESQQNRINERSVDSSATLIDSLRLMDRLDIKLLLVFAKGRFLSVVSVGDIQRAIIRGVRLDASVGSVLRDSVTVSRASEPLDEVHRRMVLKRIELMPVVDDSGQLVNTIFWDDVFGETAKTAPVTELALPVVIMAGGEGRRLLPITKIIPKPLIPVGDTPIAEAIVHRFLRYGCKRFILSVNYKSEMIRSYFDSIPDRPYTVEYIHEDKPMGTAGSLALLDPGFDKTFFVSNCDILVENDYSEIYRFHRDNRNELTVVAALRSYNIPYGTVETNSEGLLTAMREKPTLNFFVNSGMYVVDPHVVDMIPTDRMTHITDVIDQIVKRGGRVGVFPVSENSWKDIGEWREYRKTQAGLEGIGDE